jgi:N-carbamoyl-L-amino-acid hydrolase
MRARAWLKARCESAGLEVRQDAVGNTFARWRGADVSASLVGTGSHIDAIPNAGKYDGVVGVLGGLEAIRALQRSGFQPKCAIELLVFTSEEPTRFGIGCLGSRLLAGSLSAVDAEKLTDSNGQSLGEVRRNAGLGGELDSVKLRPGYYQAFVELHIEQGPILERENVPLGIVTKIAAPASGRIALTGAGGHAGGVLMQDRHDALCAAAELILQIETVAKNSGSSDTVATVGMCEVFPGAINSIPSQVRISLDVRDTDLARRDAVIREIQAAIRHVSKQRGVSISLEMSNADAPAECAQDIVDSNSESSQKHGEKYMLMVSRAYHDSLFMSRIAPVAMLFIPCRNGYSHRPDEYASIDDIGRGTLILAETLAALSSR